MGDKDERVDALASARSLNDIAQDIIRAAPHVEPLVEEWFESKPSGGEAPAGLTREDYERALVEAVVPLEVIAGQDRVKPYVELSRDLIAQVNTSIDAIRAALRGPVGGEAGQDD